MNWGAFYELYNGYGIYWRGRYNVEGSGNYRTIAEARQAIDLHRESLNKAEEVRNQEKIDSGAIRAFLDGGSVTVELPSGKVVVSITEYRRSVFAWEDTYGKEIIIV